MKDDKERVQYKEARRPEVTNIDYVIVTFYAYSNNSRIYGTGSVTAY